MTALCNPALLLVFVLGVLLFWRRPGHRVVIAMYILGVLLLPELGSTEFVENVPRPLGFGGIRLIKPNAIALGLVIGSLLFDRRRWLAAHPRWFDLPMLAWCLGPILTSVTNSLFYDDPVSRQVPVSSSVLGRIVSLLDSSDLYDGFLRAVDVVFLWGVPYLLGRLYITDTQKLRELVLAIILGSALYAPLCVVEMIASPQLHRWVYGFHQHDFLQSIRFEGYRPMVFMEHGLAVGMWMVAGALAASWLWMSGAMRHITIRERKVTALWLVVPLCVVAILCKSTGALALGALGFAVLAGSWLVQRPIPVFVLLMAFPLYTFVRTEGSWDAREVVEFTDETVGVDRGQSLEFRLHNEELLVVKAMERPLVGWGGWGRSRVQDQYGEATTVADGLWIITLGERGLIGLVTLGFLLLLPLVVLLRQAHSQLWADPATATIAIAAVILGIYSIDCLLNAMVNPVYILLGGSVMSISLSPFRTPAKLDQPLPKRWRIRWNRKPTRILAKGERPATRLH